MTVSLPDELADLVRGEAARRGISVDDLVAEAVAATIPAPPRVAGGDALEAFIGCGSSGSTEPFDIRRARAELAARKLAEGA